MNRVLDDIARIMHRVHGRDISLFEESFLAKTLEKRLASTASGSLSAYSGYLSGNGEEAELLYRSLSITYSEFFRNPLTFALLEQLILPALLDKREKAGRPEIRVWSAACAAGQEAYSIAILLDEMTAAAGRAIPFRIFATDISENVLALARQGTYDFPSVRNVRLKHLKSYFSVSDETYTIDHRLRERIDFSRYDLLDEYSGSPPASIYGDFDLVFCSNLLFYYKPEMRRFILDKVCRSLAPNGYLATGEAERDMIAGRGGLSVVAPAAAVFRKT